MIVGICVSMGGGGVAGFLLIIYLRYTAKMNVLMTRTRAVRSLTNVEPSDHSADLVICLES